MKTSSIALRVADFLKAYPPFEYMSEEDLLALAGQGRVKFHEQDEYVFEQNTPRGPWVYVVASGTVKVVKISGAGEELFDMRGPGDLLGISWFFSDKLFIHSAKAVTDVLLYALPWSGLRQCMQKYAAVSRYLAAYFSINPNYRLPDPQDKRASFSTAGHEDEAAAASAENPTEWLSGTAALVERSRRRLFTCDGTLRVRDAAKALVDYRQDAGLVVDKKGRPLGIFTSFDFSSHVATGEVGVDEPVSSLMTAPVWTVQNGLSAGELILKMLQLNVRHLCITEDGTSDSPALGLISERDMQLLHGRLPMFLGRELRRARDVDNLVLFRRRVDEHVAEYLDARLPLRWICEFVSTMDGALVKRAVELAEEGLLAENPGARRIETPWCFLAFGAEGRQERLLHAAQENGIVYGDTPPAFAEETRRWFLRLGARVANILEACGFPRSSVCVERSENVRPLEEWKRSFERRMQAVTDDAGLLASHAYFDARAVAGDIRLLEALYAHWGESMRKTPEFLTALARCALENLPPLTIFQNTIVDTDGKVETRLDVLRHMLMPLTDTARVFALAGGEFTATSTMERFAAAARKRPEKAALLNEAGESFRVALFHQAASGLHHGDDGRFLRPAELGKIDQEILKSVFRTVDELFKYVEADFHLDGSGKPA